MADPRTFVLIGNFEDNITPALANINKAIDGFKRNMASMATKRGGGYGDVTQSVGKLVSAQKYLKEAIEGVGAAAKSATQDLKDYKSMMGKVASAHYHIQKSGTAAGKAQSKFWQAAENDLDDYKRKLEALQRQTRINPYRSLSGGGGGGRSSRAATGGMMPPGGGGPPPRRGGGERDGYNFHMGAFAFGMELGQGLSQPISTAIFSGFQMGVGLMAKTMEYVQSSFMERVEDQMTDLQAAGGYYAISKRQKDPMFSSLQSAIMFTQKTNDVLERLASDLPGSTEDYVKVSKRIGDSVMRMVDANEKGAIAYARQLIEKGGLQESYRGVSLEGKGAREGAIQVILGELTKKTVLAGFGGSTGRGGAAGAYGLPALTERLITNPDTSMAQMQKYAAVFGDPKIMAAMERAMPKLKAAGADMLKRTMIVNEMFDEIAPPEMIAAMRKSMAGVLEAYRSAFFSPGTGLFGFGRKLKDASGKLQPMTDVYGRFIKVVEENGKQVEKIVQTAEEATQVDMAVFDMFADIISNFAAILKPIIDNLSLLWDPMQGIADALRGARIASAEILGSFRNYVGGIEDLAKTIPDEAKRAKFLESKSLRASILTITNLFTELGVFSEEDFSRYQKMIIDPAKGMKDLGKVLNELFKTFFDSDAAKELGKFIGELLKSIVVSLSQVTGFANQMGTSKIAEGFMEGFGKEGVAALKKIFSDIYQLLFRALTSVLQKLPWEAYVFAGLALIIPASVAGIGMAIGQGVVTLLTKAKDYVLGCFGGRQTQNMMSNMLGSCDPMGGGRGGRGGRGGAQPQAPRKAGRYHPLTGQYIPPDADPTPAPKKKGKGFGNLFIGSAGAKAAKSIQGGLKDLGQDIKDAGQVVKKDIKSVKKYLTEPVVQETRRLTNPQFPGVALGTETMPFTKRQQMQRAAQAAVGGVGRVGARLGIRPGKVGAASMAPTMQALGGLFQGGGGRALIRQRNMLGMGARSMAKMGRFVPGGALAFGGIDAAMRMSQGEDAGRAIGGAAASTIGATLGGILGQALIPIPGVGAAVGTVAGGILGDRIFNAIAPPSKEQMVAAQIQKSAALQQAQAAGVVKSGIDVEKAGGQFTFGEASEVSARLKELGVSAEPAVRSFEALYRIDQEKQKAAQSSADALNAEIKRLRDLGRPQAEIAARVKGLQTTYDKAKKDAQDSLTSLNKQWGQLGPKTTETILNSFKNMPTGAVDAAIAERIRKAGDPTSGNAGRDRRENVGTRKGETKFFENGWAGKGTYQNTGSGWEPLRTDGVSDAFGSPGKQFGNLAAAAAYENKHKPAGAKLGVFNTSETVIPAAGGYGMQDFIETLRSGFNTMVTTYKEAQQKQENTLNAIKNTLISNQQQTNARLQKLETKFSTPGMAGGLGGGAAGGVDAFTPIAQRYGLQMTSGYRPGDPGWHGANRARDFSNGTGPTPQMMQFAQYMAATYGQNLKELIYTPLGFSIKNGQRVPPYAQGSHYNHVHVAYALGPNSGRMFTSLDAAQGWESSMVPGSVKVASITGNSAEGLGGQTTINNHFEITQQAGEDSEALANRVATLFFDATKKAQSASIFI
jgi:hypothetical protein